MRVHAVVRPLLSGLCAAVTLGGTAGAEAPAPILGFSEERATAQHTLEAQFDAVLDRNNLRNWMQRLSAHPHHLGSPYGKENAEFIAGLFRSWGYETRIETFYVLFPTPRLRLLEMLAPEPFTAALVEPPLPEDATSGQTDTQLPTYNCYSADGDVTGELVYVNYGVPKDYEELERRGIDVRGKIVLARYGGSWRGIKPKVAAEHGARRLPDLLRPARRRLRPGRRLPQGGLAAASSSAQRGSVADMPLYPGDPLTPGVGATKNARRSWSCAEGADADQDPGAADLLQPTRCRCSSAIGADRWRPKPGAASSPLPYHLGPGPAQGAAAAPVRLEAGAGLRRHRPMLRRRGAAGPVDPARQPPRRLGQRRQRPGERDGGGAWPRRASLGEPRP